MTEPTLNFHIQTHQNQFKIPHELIKKNFKLIQKLIEKQRKQLIDDISKIKKCKTTSPSFKLELIQKLIKNFESFMKKLQNFINKDEEFRSRLIARLENLTELQQYVITNNDNQEGQNHEESTENNNNISNNNNNSTTTDDDKLLDFHNPNLINWYRDQTNLLIVDYLIKSNTRTRFEDNGEDNPGNIGLLLLKNLTKTNPKLLKLIDYDLLENFNKVFVSIINNHDLSLIVGWFNENKNLLNKINSNLEFEINYCKFLTLIEKGDINEAINYSRENLSGYGNKENYQQTNNGSNNTFSNGDTTNTNHLTNLERLKGLGGLLVFRSMENNNKNNNDLNSNDTPLSSKLMLNSTPFKEYQKLLSNERWESLAQCFIENFTKLYGISKNFPIYIYLSAGLSSLKTKSCYHNVENTIFKHSTGNGIDYDNGNDDYDDDDDDDDEGGVIDSNLSFISAETTTNTNTTSNSGKLLLNDPKYRGPNHYYKLLNKINNCPICSPELFKLSQNLPYAQLITSIFNNPFKLPNGNIYPFDKLLAPTDKYLSEKNTLLRANKVKDPLTREIFTIDSCIRVFPA